MKTLKLTTLLITMVFIGISSMSFTTPFAGKCVSLVSHRAILPDLKVSAISTPGGLCVGNTSKIRVSITNSQMVGIKEKIPVILFISQKGYSHSYVGYLKGIGPRSNSGQPVWFNNVVIDNSSEVTIKAVVNPDHEIYESVPNNNQKVIQAKVKGNCGQATQQEAADMVVTVYKSGTWSGGQGQPIDGAIVTVTKNGQDYTGTSGSNGKVIINAVPKGMCKIRVVKTGYLQVGPNNVEYPNGMSYNMPAYEAKVNIAMLQG